MDSHDVIWGLTLGVWNVIGIVAQTVAAIGTVAAVIVSLWLARRDGQPIVSITADIHTISDMERSSFVLTIKNKGVRTICVERIGCMVRNHAGWNWWPLGRWVQSQVFSLGPDVRLYSAPRFEERFDKEIDPGRSASYYVGKESVDQWNKVASALAFYPRSLRFWVLLSSDHAIFSSPSRKGLQLLQAAYPHAADRDPGPNPST